MPFVLGIFELIALALIGVFLLVGVVYDRRGSASPKWWVFFLGAAALIVWVGSKTDFTTLLGFVMSWELWRPLGLYIVAGLVYSAVEFFVDIRKSAKKYQKGWSSFLQNRDWTPVWGDDGKPIVETVVDRRGDSMTSPKQIVMSKAEVLSHPQALIADHPMQKYSRKLIESWADEQNSRSKYGIIGVNVIDGDVAGSWKVDPVVRRDQLASFIGAWTFFWPFYAVTLFLGDFLSELFSSIADWIVVVSKKVVDNAFAGVFTVKS